MSGVTVRQVKPEEERWKALIRAHHYLGLHQLVGEVIDHVAAVDRHWMALGGWCWAALKVTARDRWIGWTPQEKQGRLKYGAQNGRCLMLTGAQAVPNLASRVLAMSVPRLRDDWQAVHGHPLVLAETFRNDATLAWRDREEDPRGARRNLRSAACGGRNDDARGDGGRPAGSGKP